MKKKIILIALIGAILSVVIYFYTQNKEITIVALGDGLALGMTPYGIEGYSFNDYLKEDYLNKHELKAYIHEFARKGKTIKEQIMRRIFLRTGMILSGITVSVNESNR